MNFSEDGPPSIVYVVTNGKAYFSKLRVTVIRRILIFFMEPQDGIEPSSDPYQGPILPLNYGGQTFLLSIPTQNRTGTPGLGNRNSVRLSYGDVCFWTIFDGSPTTTEAIVTRKVDGWSTKISRPTEVIPWYHLVMTMRSITLLEFFCLVEGPEDGMDDDDLEFATNPHRSFSNPFDAAPKATVPRTDPKNPGLSIKKQDPMAVPKRKDTVSRDLADVFRTKNVPDARSKEVTTKPQYPGKFLGQTVVQNGQFARKGVSWIDRPTGDKKFGAVTQNQKVEWVWDGKEWITKGAWSAKYKK